MARPSWLDWRRRSVRDATVILGSLIAAFSFFDLGAEFRCGNSGDRAAEFADRGAKRRDDYHVIHLRGSSIRDLLQHQSCRGVLKRREGGGKEGAVYASGLALVEKNVAAR